MVPRLVETVMVGTARITVAETVARPVRARRQEMIFMLVLLLSGDWLGRGLGRYLYRNCRCYHHHNYHRLHCTGRLSCLCVLVDLLCATELNMN